MKRLKTEEGKRAVILILLISFAFSGWLPYMNEQKSLTTDENTHIYTIHYMNQFNGDYKKSAQWAFRMSAYDDVRILHPELNETEAMEEAKKNELEYYRSPLPFMLMWRFVGGGNIPFKVRFLTGIVLCMTLFLIFCHFEETWKSVAAGTVFLSSSVAAEPEIFLMEPFQCLFLTIAVLLVLKERHNYALLSLTAAFFFKEVSLLYIAIFGLYYTTKKDWKHLGTSVIVFLICYGVYYGINPKTGNAIVGDYILSAFTPQAFVYSLKFTYNLGYLTPLVLVAIVVGLRHSKSTILLPLVLMPMIFFMTMPGKYMGQAYDYWEYVRYVFHPLGGLLSIIAVLGLEEIRREVFT